MKNDRMLIDKLRQEVLSGKITYDDIVRRLSIAIENEYLKDTPNVEFVDSCEDFLWEIGTEHKQQFVSVSDRYLAMIDQCTQVSKKNDSKRTPSMGFAKRFAVICAAFAVLVFITQGTIRFAWFTQHSSPDEQQYIIQGHDVNINLVQECIAEHGGVSALKTNSWNELCDYLGFAPSVIAPDVLNVDQALYQVYVDPSLIMVNALYESEPGVAIAVLTIQYFADTDEAHFIFEQDAVGDKLSLYDCPVYTSTNVDHISYCWISDSTITFLTGTFDPEIGLEIVKELIGGTENE